MAYIKAYSDENRRHPDLWGAGITDEQLLRFYSEMCQHFGLKQIPVEFTKRRGGGTFFGGINVFRRLAFTPKMSTLLLLAHEFAHYLTYWERSQEYNQLVEQHRAAIEKSGKYGATPTGRAAAELARVLLGRRTKLASRNGHSKDFAANVDRVCALVYEQQWIRDTTPVQQVVVDRLRVAAAAAKNEPAMTETARAGFDLKAYVFDNLPEYLWCRRCDRELPKEQVGVRVTSRYVDGSPAKVIRQSYCRTCRSSK